MTIDIVALRYFASVANNRNVSRAAEELHVSQSAVSRQIKLLESALGEQLLQRTNRGIVLTESGHVVHERAQAMLRLVEELKVDVAVVARRPSGRLRIGFPSSLGKAMIVPTITELAYAYPDLHLTLFEGFSDEVSTMVAQDKLDLGIISRPVLSNSLATIPAFREEIWLFHTPENWHFAQKSLSARALAGLPLVSTKLVGWQIGAWLAEHGYATGRMTETNSGTTLAGLARAGIGYIAAPLTSCLNELEAGEVVGAPIEGLSLTRYFVERQGITRSVAADFFHDAIRRTVSAQRAMKEA